MSGLISRSIRRSLMLNNIGQPDRRVIERKCQRRAMEVPAGKNISVSIVGREYQRIVGRRARLCLDYRRRMIEHAAHRAMHLRHAAQAVRILHPRIVQPVRLADLAVAQAHDCPCGQSGKHQAPCRPPESEERKRRNHHGRHGSPDITRHRVGFERWDAVCYEEPAGE